VLRTIVRGDIRDTPSDSAIAGRLVGIADSDGDTGVSPDISQLLMRLHRVYDHMIPVWVDPGLGRLRRAVGHQRGDEAWVRASHQFDETVREIHEGDDSAGPRTDHRAATLTNDNLKR
jgi:hypothetical protein